MVENKEKTIAFNVSAKKKSSPRNGDNQQARWDRSLERRKPGRKKGPSTAQLHPRLQLEIIAGLNQLSDQHNVSVGKVIEKLYQHWVKDGADLFENE